jgi:hypothetical protein
MWRRTERASLEKKPSMRLSQEPCLGVKVKSNLPAGELNIDVFLNTIGKGDVIVRRSKVPYRL